MIKTTYFCDKCKQEMKKPEAGNIVIVSDGKLFGVELKPFTLDGAPLNNIDNLHICNYCIIDLIVRKLDDRTKAA